MRSPSNLNYWWPWEAGKAVETSPLHSMNATVIWSVNLTWLVLSVFQEWIQKIPSTCWCFPKPLLLIPSCFPEQQLWHRPVGSPTPGSCLCRLAPLWDSACHKSSFTDCAFHAAWTQPLPLPTPPAQQTCRRLRSPGRGGGCWWSVVTRCKHSCEAADTHDSTLEQPPVSRAAR